MTKLSDERLNEIRTLSEHGFTQFSSSLRELTQHIEAITAERDNAIRHVQQTMMERDNVTKLCLENQNTSDENNKLALKWKSERDRLSQECAVYKEALKFYAKEENYTMCWRTDLEEYVPANSEGTSEIEYWKYKRAREALAKGAGIMERK